MLAGIAVAVFNSHDRIKHYLSHPFQMVETLEPQATTIPFPSVTVCSAFPMPVLGQTSQTARELIDHAKNSQCYNDSSYREYLAEEVSAMHSQSIHWGLYYSILTGGCVTGYRCYMYFVVTLCSCDLRVCNYNVIAIALLDYSTYSAHAYM